MGLLPVLLVALLLLAGGGAEAAEMRTVTFASDPKQAYFLLETLAAHKHTHVEVLGNGTRFTGPADKLRLLRSFLGSASLQPADLLLVCDGYLSLAAADPPAFERNFASFRADVVFAASEGPPDVAAADTRFARLSSAAFMGRVAALREILGRGDADTFASDADFYRAAYRSGRFNVSVDTRKVLFCGLGDHEGRDAEEILDGASRFIVKETASVPALIFASKTEGMHAFYRILRRKVQPKIRISNIQVHSAPVLKRGETLWLELTVANFNEFPLQPQLPDPAHVYNSTHNFGNDGFESEYGSFRIGLDFEGRTGVDHPYRWGLGEKILSGNQKTVVLGVAMDFCMDKRTFRLGYVLEHFFWVIDLFSTQVTVEC